MEIIVHASTPEDLRSELLEWFRNRHQDASTRLRIRNQSQRNRILWAARASVLEEAAFFLTKLKIEPKTQLEEPAQLTQDER